MSSNRYIGWIIAAILGALLYRFADVLTHPGAYRFDFHHPLGSLAVRGVDEVRPVQRAVITSQPQPSEDVSVNHAQTVSSEADTAVAAVHPDPQAISLQFAEYEAKLRDEEHIANEQKRVAGEAVEQLAAARKELADTRTQLTVVRAKLDRSTATATVLAQASPVRPTYSQQARYMTLGTQYCQPLYWDRRATLVDPRGDDQELTRTAVRLRTEGNAVVLMFPYSSVQPGTQTSEAVSALREVASNLRTHDNVTTRIRPRGTTSGYRDAWRLRESLVMLGAPRSQVVISDDITEAAPGETPGFDVIIDKGLNIKAATAKP